MRLVTRRNLPVPTLWGWLLLGGMLLLGVIALGRFGYPILAVEKPAAGAQVLVVEGWLGPRELDQAAAVFRRGAYERLITSGGPITNWASSSGPSTYADRAADYLTSRGIDAGLILSVPSPASAQDRSYLSAVMVREALSDAPVKALDVFSAGTHARRTRMVYRLALGSETSIGILAAGPDEYDPEHWWRYSAGVNDIMKETLSVLWTFCCFHPPPPGSDEEMWGRPR